MTLQEVEKHRLDFIYETKKALFILFLIIFVFTAIQIMYKYEFIAFLSKPATFIFISLWFGDITTKWNKYREFYKLNVTRSIITNILLTANYMPSESVDKEVVRQSRLVSEYFNYFRGEDLICFQSFGNLRLCEIKLGDESSKKLDIEFKGLFGYAEFPFDFEGTTIVKPKKFMDSVFNNKGFEDVRLESPRFMDIWDIKSTSQLGARLALGTDIMNNLLYFHDNIKKNISLSFIGNKVYIAISQTTFLESDFIKPVFDQESVKQIQQEIRIVHDLIQTFKLRQSRDLPSTQVYPPTDRQSHPDILQG